MLCDGPLSEENLLNPAQTEFFSLGTVDVLSEYTLMLQEKTMEEHRNASKCDQGAVRSRVHRGRHGPVLAVESLSETLWCYKCAQTSSGRVCQLFPEGWEDLVLFAEKCGGCGEAALSSDLVVRAGGQIYHPECLHCSLCGSLLMPGESFKLGPGGPFCQAEKHDAREREPQRSGTGRRGGVWERRWVDRGRGRGVQVRTVLRNSQLRALQTCNSQTQLTGHLIGLSPRVNRVWFQNKRCKDKKSHAKRGGRPVSDLDFTVLLCASARPMVFSPEPPDFALQIYTYKSSWQPLDGQLKPFTKHESTCSSEDLDSPQQHSDESVAILTI
ncbi:unnamed protein product [Coregonus sp. 'balchen']|nr:unnamed protein product [Coregonus sp. 'balchen']